MFVFSDFLGEGDVEASVWGCCAYAAPTRYLPTLTVWLWTPIIWLQQAQQVFLMPCACHRHPVDARLRGGKVSSIPKTGDDWIPVTGTGKREVGVANELQSDRR